MPVLNTNLSKPRLDKTIPLGFVYDTWLRVYLYLGMALALQGNDRSFEILAALFEILEKNKIDDEVLICKAKLTLAYANTMKGNFKTSQEVLSDIANIVGAEYLLNPANLNSARADIINYYNIINILNNFFRKDFNNIKESLFNAAKFASDTSNEFLKNIFRTFLGKYFYDTKQAKHAIEVYNEQITYFANNKMALGALLTWYFISEATMVTEDPKNAIDIALQTLDIAQNPRINNSFFIVLLKILLAKAYMEISDYETAKINLESGMVLAKKYSMNDLLSKIYLLYGKYYQDLGSINSQNQQEYLKGSAKMYDNAMNIVLQDTCNPYMRDRIEQQKNLLLSYCEIHNLNL